VARDLPLILRQVRSVRYEGVKGGGITPDGYARAGIFRSASPSRIVL
jgi:hypothetical protein